MESEKQNLITSFLDIAVGQSAETAARFLQATSWRLDEAIHLFYVGNEGGGVGSSPQRGSSAMEDALGSVVSDAVEDGVRAPLPIVREALYNDSAYYRFHSSSDDTFREFKEESRRPDVWETDRSNASTATTSGDNLASLYRPPIALMYHGSFDKAKVEASFQGKWLLVNLQSTEEFSSHMLNRDTWSNEAVVDTVRGNFVFWQVYRDTTEGRKVCTYYKLRSLPAILVIDPVTGQKMRAWSGMVHAEELLEDLVPYLDKGPKDHMALPHKRLRESAQPPPSSLSDVDAEEDDEVRMAILASLEGFPGSNDALVNEESKTDKDAVANATEKPKYPPLPEEPNAERSLMCKVAIRLPNGRRLQRNFLRADPTKLLWSFCYCEVEEAKTKTFHFALVIPGASRSIDYESKLTMEEAGLSNSMISLVWE